jgi:hypothetical protein
MRPWLLEHTRALSDSLTTVAVLAFLLGALVALMGRSVSSAAGVVIKLPKWMTRSKKRNRDLEDSADWLGTSDHEDAISNVEEQDPEQVDGRWIRKWRLPSSGDPSDILEEPKTPSTSDTQTIHISPRERQDVVIQRLEAHVWPGDTTRVAYEGDGPAQQTLRERLGPPDFKNAASKTDPRGVVVWFGTDRQRESSYVVRFSGERAQFQNPLETVAMRYGTAYITLPPSHVTGQIEQRRCWQIFADPLDARRFVVIHPPQILPEDRFFEDVAFHVREASRKDVLVFVHGYNVSFDDGLKRLAQITVDLGFEGAPILYSWPSESRTRD